MEFYKIQIKVLLQLFHQNMTSFKETNLIFRYFLYIQKRNELKL